MLCRADGGNPILICDEEITAENQIIVPILNNGDCFGGVILYDKDMDTEEFVYFIGYKHRVQENDMEITLSNKKTEQEDGLTIADYLTGAKNSMREFDAKKYLLIQQKYNRLNLPREYIAKYKEEERKRPDGIVID